MIEKHFTLRRADGGVDSAFSMEPEELKALVVECESAFQSLGKIQYGILPVEEKSRNFKRSIYISSDMQAGDVITESNIRIIRPGLGLESKYFEIVLGKKINKDVVKGTPLTWDLI